MSRDLSSLEELERAVQAAPDNYGLRRRLLERLLEVGDAAAAQRHLNVLLTALPKETWVLSLGMQVATVLEDSLQVARFRRQLRQSLQEIEDGEDDDDDEWEVESQQMHPSLDAETKVHAPHLRLLTGGASAAEAVGNKDRPSRRLIDIGGLNTVKRHLADIIESVQVLGDLTSGPWLGGVLLYGPPSCGKAFSGRVVAHELDAPLWFFDLSNAWQPRELEDLLGRAIAEASTSNHPCVIYFDNLDAADNTDLMRTLLPVLDASRSKAKVVILGAATLPWQVSTNVVRQGRLGRVLLVLPPDAPSRRDFLVECFTDNATVTNDDLDWLVAHTEGHSFGDLERLVEVAIDTHTEGASTAIPHDTIRRARQRIGPSSADWLNTAGHHALMNEAGGLYDDLLRYFRSRQRPR